MNEIFKLKIFIDIHSVCLKQIDMRTVKGNQNHHPIKGWIQNHTKNLSEKL